MQKLIEMQPALAAAVSTSPEGEDDEECELASDSDGEDNGNTTDNQQTLGDSFPVQALQSLGRRVSRFGRSAGKS